MILGQSPAIAAVVNAGCDIGWSTRWHAGTATGRNRSDGAVTAACPGRGGGSSAQPAGKAGIERRTNWALWDDKANVMVCLAVQ
jgi:hypothetical protein